MKIARLAALVALVGLPRPTRAEAPAAEPSAAAEDADQTLARVEAVAQRWKESRDDARTMLAAFADGATDDWYRALAKTLGARAEAGELEQEDWRHTLAALVSADGAAGKISAAETKRRLDHVERLYRLRALYIWGSLIPRAIEESGGRKMAGPSWRVRLAQPDFETAQRVLVERSKIPADELFKKFWTVRLPADR